MKKLDISHIEAKAAQLSNSKAKPLGIRVAIADIQRGEPFASLFAIKPEVLHALTEDMKLHGFDQSKPVNVWKKPDGNRVLVDGYTRLLAAEAAGLLEIVAFDSSFKDEEEALAYAIHTQRDRRNLSDAELLRLVGYLDEKHEGFRGPLASRDANGGYQGKSAARTAATLQVSATKIERARSVFNDFDERAAVLAGKKTINQAAKDARRKKQSQKLSVQANHPAVIRQIPKKVAIYLERAELEELCALLRDSCLVQGHANRLDRLLKEAELKLGILVGGGQ